MNSEADELDLAFRKALRGPEGFPELFRRLRENVLFFLMPYHPEMMGTHEAINGQAIYFVEIQNEQGKFIPVYTSEKYVEHALKTMRLGESRYGLGEMQGQALFQILGNQPLSVALNAASGVGQIMMKRATVQRIADGSILHPMEKDTPQEHGRVQIVNAADYPTNLLQPLFQLLRERKEARAAWLFRRIMPGQTKKIYYVFGLLVNGDGEALKQDFSCVANSQAKMGYGVTIIDLKDAAMLAVLKKFPPFFAAPDFHWPQALEAA